MKTTVKIVVIAMMGMGVGVSAQEWNTNGDNSTTGNLTLDGSYINLNTPVTTGGWARGFLNIDTDKVTRIGGVGLLGAKDQPNYYYIAHGKSPWSSGLGIYVKTNGNVGIGTTEAKEKLDIRGNIYINSGVNDNRIFWEGHNMTMGTRSGSYSHNVFSLKPGGATQGKLFSVFDMYDANSKSDHQRKIRIHSSGTSYFNGGNVGIGTTDTKGFELGVNGKIAATEVKVATYSNWADFVFKKDYHLPTLKEVENHIKEKGHLKDIPSAKEVEKNGFFLGEMDSKLLQKIEELTLYTVAQEKEIKKEKAENKKQQKEIEELKALVQKLLKDKN